MIFQVKLQALNDSHYIGMSIYNVVVLSLLAVLVSVFVDENVNLLFGLLSGITVFGTTATQCLVFVPKVTCFRRCGWLYSIYLLCDVSCMKYSNMPLI